MAKLTFDGVRIHFHLTTDENDPKHNSIALHGSNMDKVTEVTLSQAGFTFSPNPISSNDDSNFTLVSESKIRLTEIVVTADGKRIHDDGDGTLTVTLNPLVENLQQPAPTDNSPEL
jgi:hypothetical protein